MSNKEEENKLDLQIRSLMENAEEPVPEHLWATISDRLDAAEALAGKRMVIPVWLKRAAIGLAAAAAVALGVFLFVPRHHAAEDERVAVVNPSEDSAASTQNAVSTASPSSRAYENSAASEPSIASQIASSPNYIAQTLEKSAEAFDGQGNGNDIIERSEESENGTISETESEEASAIESSESSISSSESTISASAESASSSSEPEVTVDAAGTDGLEDMSSWSEDEFRDGQTPGTRRKIRTAIVMAGDAMGNGSTTSSTSGGLNRQLSSSIVQQTTPGISESSKSSFSIPASFGLGVKIIFTPRWSLGVGLNYSILSRTFSGIYTTYSADTDSYNTTSYSRIRHNVSYIGIPVNAYFSIVSSHAVDFYAYAGGSIEKAVGNKYVLEDEGYYKEGVKGVQCSADLGIGVEFTIVDMVGLYIDPSIRYYFPNSHQPTSIRTQEPFTFGFEIGFRIRL